MKPRETVSSAEVWAFLERHNLTQRSFCRWVGVSPRTFQAWAKNGKFPRTIEIIVTEELPPRRGAPKSKISTMLEAAAELGV